MSAKSDSNYSIFEHGELAEETDSFSSSKREFTPHLPMKAKRPLSCPAAAGTCTG